MNLIIICNDDGTRSVFIPRGEPTPIVARPELWTGQGSQRYSSHQIDMTIGGTVLPEARVFEARATSQWIDSPDGPGIEILRISEPDTGWGFALEFLKFWLKWVFGSEITLKIPTATIGRSSYVA